MRKRLQKKLQSGPYKRYGFKISGTFNSDTDQNAFIDSFIEFLDENDLYCAAGFGPELDFDLYIDCGTRKMDPEQGYKKVCDWVKQNPAVTSHEATTLVDAWDYPYQR
ncbi:MAG: 50S ribosome-binding protein YggL [Planctomycetota bacterium]|jgi:uncharacterized protein YggL (DUF469 family)